MPNGTDMGPGWVQDANGQWIYSPTTDPSTLDVESLDYGQELAGSTLADDWEKYFDAYDPTKEQMLGRAVGIDIGQLGEAWGLQSQQLGESWGLQRGELGAKAGLGFRQARQAGTSARGKSGLAYSGTAAGMQRGAERDVMGQYGRGMQAGKTAYEQAMATGQLGLQQATTDIYQGLESDIYGERQRWEREQRSNLNTLLGLDIWNIEGREDNTVPNASTPSQDSHRAMCNQVGNRNRSDCQGMVEGWTGCYDPANAGEPECGGEGTTPRTRCEDGGGTWVLGPGEGKAAEQGGHCE